MTHADDLDRFLALEKRVWAALATGDMQADTALLTGDFLGVYATGFSDRTQHAEQLRSGPTVLHYDLSEARLMMLSPDLALLAYRADFVRNDAADKDTHTMYISSIWRREGDDWRNVFSQDTAATHG